MKKYLFFLLIGSISLQSFAQKSTKAADTTMRYYSRLARSTSESDKVQLETILYQLLKSNNEKDWSTAANFFYQMRKAGVADSIQKAIKVKFPEGMAVRNAKADTIYKQIDPLKKEAMYKAWIKKYPPARLGEDRIQYDYVRNSVAIAYSEANNVKKALEYANMIETPVWKGEGWAGPAQTLAKKGHLKEAEGLYKKAIANSYKYMTSHRKDQGAGFAAMGYVGYNNSLGEILLQEKRYPEALKYIKAAHDSSKTVRGNVNSSYAKILMTLGRNKQAFDMIDEAVKAGQATPEMKETLKKLYAKVKGDNGYDEYLASVNKLLAEKIRKDVQKQMINLPAPMFTLKDVNGKTVSLEELKGKIVIVDFWATWCGPCKASFPAMQMALNRYKDDSDVQFLFVHTWERADTTATQNAKKYIEEKKYPFEVLMDLKDPVTGENNVINSYKVTGIPTKFVIDKNGNIRFRFTGFSGGNDAAVEEVSAMIELAKKG